MEMIAVNSSNLRSVGYDEAVQTLVLVFKNGSYQYSNVPKETYDGLINASSKGSYVHKSIVGKFPVQKIS